MKILFLHGWQSIVGGVKPTHLKNAGHEVLNPALDHDDFEAALRTAQRVYDLEQPDVIVGSSRGGALAMNLRCDNTPLVLLCPAWKKWGTAQTIRSNSVVLHSPDDEVIPFRYSEELIANSRLPADTLIAVGNDHRLADPSSLAVMLWACEVLFQHDHIPWGDEAPANFASSANATTGSNSSPVEKEASYLCDACGEEIVIPLDLSEGTTQRYVEDCPVCCRANIIHVDVDDDGNAQVWAEPEQDHD